MTLFIISSSLFFLYSPANVSGSEPRRTSVSSNAIQINHDVKNAFRIDVAFSYIIEKLKDVSSLKDRSFALDVRGSEPLVS
jgi:hypothetical protein